MKKMILASVMAFGLLVSSHASACGEDLNKIELGIQFEWEENGVQYGMTHIDDWGGRWVVELESPCKRVEIVYAGFLDDFDGVEMVSSSCVKEATK